MILPSAGHRSGGFLAIRVVDNMFGLNLANKTPHSTGEVLCGYGLCRRVMLYACNQLLIITSRRIEIGTLDEIAV